MLAHRSAVGIQVHAPAKINLFLEVVAKRDDGFHEIETLVVPVSLYDTVSICGVGPAAAERGPVTLEVAVTAGLRATIPGGGENLAVRAAELLRWRAGVDAGLAIRLVKRIPAGAGLGGGSSDAAAVLIGANARWGLGWSRARLMELAAELGSDVPFFLAGSAAICRGRGERVEPLGGGGGWHVVIFKPAENLATADVYRRCRPPVLRRQVEAVWPAWGRGDGYGLRRTIYNRLQPAAGELLPSLPRIQAEFARLDFVAHQLTGTGSAYFGICRHARQARRLAETLRGRLTGSVYPVRLAC